MLGCWEAHGSNETRHSRGVAVVLFVFPPDRIEVVASEPTRALDTPQSVFVGDRTGSGGAN